MKPLKTIFLALITAILGFPHDAEAQSFGPLGQLFGSARQSSGNLPVPGRPERVPAAGGFYGSGTGYGLGGAKSQVTSMLANSLGPGPDQAKYQNLYRKWNGGTGVPIVIDGGEKNGQCVRRGALAISSKGKGRILVCQLLLRSYPQNLTQTLIHELAHVSGYGNECLATRLARGAARNSGMAPYSNGYNCPN